MGRINSFPVSVKATPQLATIGKLAGLSICMLLATLSTSSASIALPTLAAAFATTVGAVQWVVIAYLLSMTALIVGAGSLGDLLGKKRLLMAGLIVFTLASIFCAISETLWQLVLARLIQGIGAAAMLALSTALVSEAVPEKKIGVAMGLLGTMSAVGTASGPMLGGLLIDAYGWPSIFWLISGLGLLGLILSLLFLQQDKLQCDSAKAGFDMTGLIVLALALAAYAFSMTTEKGSFGFGNAIWLLVALAGCYAFARIEKKTANPLIRLSLLRNQTFNISLISNVVVACTMMATLIIGPFYLSIALGLNTQLTGLAMSAGPAAAALVGFPAGKAVDWFGTYKVALFGLGQMILGVLLMVATSHAFGLVGYMVSLLTLTTGFQLFLAANNTGIMREAGHQERGLIAGLLNLSRNLGFITGASLMGTVFTFAAGTVDIATISTEAVIQGLQGTFMLAAVMLALMLIAIAFRGLKSL